MVTVLNIETYLGLVLYPFMYVYLREGDRVRGMLTQLLLCHVQYRSEGSVHKPRRAGRKVKLSVFKMEPTQGIGVPGPW